MSHSSKGEPAHSAVQHLGRYPGEHPPAGAAPLQTEGLTPPALGLLLPVTVLVSCRNGLGPQD